MPEQENHHHHLEVAVTEVLVGLGTSGQEVLAFPPALLQRAGKNLHSETYYVRFDAQPPPLENIADLLEVDPGPLLGTDELVCSSVPGDAASIAAWERTGQLRFLPAGYFRCSTNQIDKPAAGGLPCFGRTQIGLRQEEYHDKIDKQICRARSYDRRVKNLAEGGPADTVSARLPVTFIATAVNGTGTGCLYHTIDVTAPWLNQKQGQTFSVRIVCSLSLGMQVQDPQRAKANQYNWLVYARARQTGMYRDPLTGQCQPWLIDQFCLTSDQGRWGVINDYERLLADTGHGLYLNHTPMGQKVRNRTRDCEDSDNDEWGEDRFVSSQGHFDFRWDRRRATRFCQAEAGYHFTDWLLHADNPQAARQRAADLAETCQLIESEERNDLTAFFLQIQVSGEPLLKRNRGILQDRVGQARRPEDVITAYLEALEDGRQGDLPDLFEPVIKAQARLRRKTVLASLEQACQEMQQAPEGLQVALRCLISLQEKLAKTQEAVVAKIESLHSLCQPLADNIAAATERWQQWCEASWLSQKLMLFWPRRIAAIISESVPQLLDAELQIAVCNIALEELVNPLRNYLQQKLVALQLHQQYLQEAKTLFEQQGQKSLRKSSKLLTPVGMELTDGKGCLPGFFQRLLPNLGGQVQMNQDLLARVLHRHTSLAGLVGESPQRLQNLLGSIILEILNPLIDRHTVETELAWLYPTEQALQELFQEGIRQSAGRLPIVPDVGYTETWVKVLGVPEGANLDRWRSLCEQLDSTSGDWQDVVHNDGDYICLIQVRTHLRLTPLIKMLEPANQQEWEEFVRRAPDPPSTLMVGPQPNDRQLKRVLVEALASNLLHYESAEGWVLQSREGAVLLGEDAIKAADTLRHQWKDSVYIQTTFHHLLVVAEERLRADLRQWEQTLAQAQSPDKPVGALIDRQAVQDAQQLLRQLLSWAKRMRTALPKENDHDSYTYQITERTAD